MSSYCSECGNALKSGAAFCVSCGTKVPSKAPAPTSAPNQAPQTALTAQQAVKAPTNAGPQASQKLSLVAQAKSALTSDQMKRAIGLSAAIWVGVFVFMLIAGSLISSALESTNEQSTKSQDFQMPGMSVFAAGIMLLGLGGRITGTASELGSMGAEESSTAHMIFLVVPMLLALFLYVVHSRQFSKLTGSARTWYPIFAAAPSVIAVLILWAMSSGDITFTDDGETAVLHYGVQFLLPLLISLVLGWLASGGYTLLAKNSKSSFVQNVKPSIVEFWDVFKPLLWVALAAGIVISIFIGITRGSGLTDLTFSQSLGIVTAFALLLPNLLASGLLALLGTTAHVTTIGADSSDPIAETLPIQFIGVFIIVIVVFLLGRIGRGKTKPSVNAWWVGAVVFAVLGLVLTWLLSAGVDGLGEKGFSSVSLHANPVDTAVRFAILGMVVGAASHPSVIKALRVPGAIVWSIALAFAAPFKALGRVLAKAFTQDRQPTALSQFLTSIPRWFVGGAISIAAMLVLMFATAPIGSALAATQPSPETVMQDIETALKAGNGEAVKDLIMPGSDTQVGNSTGVDSTEVTWNNSESTPTASLTWKVGDQQGGWSNITFSKSSSNTAYWGLVPAWTPNINGHLPTVSANTYDQEVSFTAGGVSVGGGSEVQVAPGKVAVKANAKDGAYLATSATTNQVTAADGNTSVDVETSLTKAGKSQAIQLVTSKMKSCQKGDTSTYCGGSDYGFCRWIAAPSTSKFVATLAYDDRVEVAVKSGKAGLIKSAERVSRDGSKCEPADSSWNDILTGPYTVDINEEGKLVLPEDNY